MQQQCTESGSLNPNDAHGPLERFLVLRDEVALPQGAYKGVAAAKEGEGGRSMLFVTGFWLGVGIGLGVIVAIQLTTPDEREALSNDVRDFLRLQRAR